MDTPIELVIFSARHVIFGAYAGQVEEILKAEDVRAEPGRVFFSFRYKGSESRGVDFSLWLEQQDSRVRPGFEKKCENGPSDTTLLILKHAGPEYRGVRIDRIEELIMFSLNQIHTLPVLVQKLSCTPALWGIAQREDRLIPLIDLSQLVVNDKGEIAI